MSKSKTKEMISVDDWTRDFIRTIVIENIKLLAEEERKLGSKYRGQLFSSFLASYIGALMFQSLQKGKSVDSTTFSSMKSLIQEAVSAGFSGAISQATGANQDYFCQVKAIPPVPSKAVN